MPRKPPVFHYKVVELTCCEPDCDEPVFTKRPDMKNQRCAYHKQLVKKVRQQAYDHARWLRIRPEPKRHTKVGNPDVFIPLDFNTVCDGCLWLSVCRERVHDLEYKLPCWKESGTMFKQYCEQYPEVLKQRGA